jgi:hypothetical protein
VRDRQDSFEAFGRYLRTLRGNLTLEAMGNRLGVSYVTVSRAEKGLVTAQTAGLYDRYFSGTGDLPEGEIVARHGRIARYGGQEVEERPCEHGELAALAQAGGGVVVVLPPEASGQLAGLLDGRTLALPDGSYRVMTSTGSVDMPIDRRLFVAGAGVALPAPALLEQTRHGLFGSLVADRSAADVDEWQEIAWEYGISFGGTPPMELLGRLQVDLAALGEALQRPHTDIAKRELHRVAALLAFFTAYTVADLGDVSSSRRWWRTAKQAADASGDIQTRLWVRGNEVVCALFEQRPVPVILDLVAEAEAISASAKAPPAAIQKLLAGKTQALALTGQAAAAETALNEVRENFCRLPAHITRDTASYFGWPEAHLRFTESYVYSFLGDYARAEQAQAAALVLFPATKVLGPAKIKLHRALCLVRNGDTTPGVEHAQTVMIDLPRERHDHVVADLGRTVLDAVPVAERGRDGVREFRSYLGRGAA